MAGKASAGISLRSITTLRSRSSNPWKIVLATNPGGGTMPMRKPSGNTGSAPSAGMPAARAQIRISHVTKRGMETLTRCRGPMARNRAIIRRQRRSGSRFAHAPERQIDAAAVRQQGRGAGHDAVGPDFYQIGAQLGDLTVRVLKGEDMAKIPIGYELPKEYGVNLKALNGLKDQWRIPP